VKDSDADLLSLKAKPMFILHVDVKVKPGMADALNATYHNVFLPAIAKQPGFCDTKLLQARSVETRTHRLVIAFEKEELQKKWVATDLHQEVWPKMEANIAQYSVDFFDSL
jgi:heme-degrading monooxygenase HmoA